MPAVEAPPAPPSTAAASSSIAAAARSASAMAGGTGQSAGAGKNMNDAFAALEGKGTNEDGSPVAKQAPAPKVAPKPQQKPATPPAAKVEPKQETPPEETTDETPTETPPAAKTDHTTQPPKPKKPADLLREEKEKWQTRARELEAEVAKYKEPKEDPEKKTLSEKLEQTVKEMRKIDEELRFSNYERSQEYKEKWEKPFIDSYQSGRSKISALKVTDAATGETRPGTPADFDAIMSQNSDEAAAEMIESMFGSGARAQIVTMAREKVLEANNARQSALDEFKKNGSEREKQMRETTEKVQKEIGSHWQDSIKPEKVPDQWKPYILPKGLDAEGKPIDEEGDGLLERGYNFYDQVSAEDARNPQLTPEQRKEVIARAASVRHRAAAFSRLTKWVAQRDSRIAELEKELEQYRGTEPGPGEGEATETEQNGDGGTMKTAMAGLEKLGTPGQFY